MLYRRLSTRPRLLRYAGATAASFRGAPPVAPSAASWACREGSTAAAAAPNGSGAAKVSPVPQATDDVENAAEKGRPTSIISKAVRTVRSLRSGSGTRRGDDGGPQADTTTTSASSTAAVIVDLGAAPVEAEDSSAYEMCRQDHRQVGYPLLRGVDGSLLTSLRCCCCGGLVGKDELVVGLPAVGEDASGGAWPAGSPFQRRAYVPTRRLGGPSFKATLATKEPSCAAPSVLATTRCHLDCFERVILPRGGGVRAVLGGSIFAAFPDFMSLPFDGPEQRRLLSIFLGYTPRGQPPGGPPKSATSSHGSAADAPPWPRSIRELLAPTVSDAAIALYLEQEASFHTAISNFTARMLDPVELRRLLTVEYPAVGPHISELDDEEVVDVLVDGLLFGKVNGCPRCAERVKHVAAVAGPLSQAGALTECGMLRWHPETQRYHCTHFHDAFSACMYSTPSVSRFGLLTFMDSISAKYSPAAGGQGRFRLGQHVEAAVRALLESSGRPTEVAPTGTAVAKRTRLHHAASDVFDVFDGMAFDLGVLVLPAGSNIATLRAAIEKAGGTVVDGSTAAPPTGPPQPQLSASGGGDMAAFQSSSFFFGSIAPTVWVVVAKRQPEPGMVATLKRLRQSNPDRYARMTVVTVGWVCTCLEAGRVVGLDESSPEDFLFGTPWPQPTASKQRLFIATTIEPPYVSSSANQNTAAKAAAAASAGHAAAAVGPTWGHRKIACRGRFIVDPFCDIPRAAVAHDATGAPFSATLTLVDLASSTNLYVVMQLLTASGGPVPDGSGRPNNDDDDDDDDDPNGSTKSTAVKSAYLYLRRGGLGGGGESQKVFVKSVDAHTTLESGIAAFTRTFFNLTGNAWRGEGPVAAQGGPSKAAAAAFVKYPGKYLWVDQDNEWQLADGTAAVGGGAAAAAAAPLKQIMLDGTRRCVVKKDLPVAVDVDGHNESLRRALCDFNDRNSNKKKRSSGGSCGLTLTVDTTKLPLENISAASLAKGYEILRELEGMIQPTAATATASLPVAAPLQRVISKTNEFFSYIPHVITPPPIPPRATSSGAQSPLRTALPSPLVSPAWMTSAGVARSKNPIAGAVTIKPPPEQRRQQGVATVASHLINTPERIAEKRRRLEEIETMLLKKTITSPGDSFLQQYHLELLQPPFVGHTPEETARKTEEYRRVSTYVTTTQGSTHSKFKLRAVWKIDRPEERNRWSVVPPAAVKNRKLLWHGSTKQNWISILTSGLWMQSANRGGMFGGGIYFADMLSKAANYGDGELLTLAEVALGDMLQETNSAHHDATTIGKHHSVFGMGQTMPNPAQDLVLENGAVMPLGVPVANPLLKGAARLLYNEYIVYNANQIQMRYLVWVKKY